MLNLSWDWKTGRGDKGQFEAISRAYTLAELAQGDKGLGRDTPIRQGSCGELVQRSHGH